MLHFKTPVLVCRSLSQMVVLASITIAPLASGVNAFAQPNDQDSEQQRCIVVELYVSDATLLSKEALDAANRFVKSHAGVMLAVRRIDDSEKARQRLRSIAHHFRFDEHTTPVIYACNRVTTSGVDSDDFSRQLADALTLEVYTRNGCRRCEAAKSHIPSISQRYPGMRIVYREITTDRAAQRSLNDLVRKHQKAAISTPVFHFCDQLIVGFDRPETTGDRIRKTLDKWTASCPNQVSQPSVAEIKRSAAQEVAAKDPF